MTQRRKFELKFDMENAAFEEAPELELARILRDLAARIEVSGAGVPSEYVIRDVNGNRVGEAYVLTEGYD